MNLPWTWLAVLAGVLLAWGLFRPFLAFVLAPAIARQVLANQPDRIHLDPVGDEQWAKAADRDRLSQKIMGLEFRLAGGFAVRELPGVKLRLFANFAESAYAVVYEHPQAVTWFEFVVRYQDGGSCTWTTTPDTGLSQRPGHPIRHVPGASVASLWKTVARERPARPMKPAAAISAAADFEAAWAEGIAWRKQQGLSRAEVARASMRKAA